MRTSIPDCVATTGGIRKVRVVLPTRRRFPKKAVAFRAVLDSLPCSSERGRRRRAPANAGFSDGGGIFTLNGTLNLVGCTLANNEADDFGSSVAIYADGNFGDGVVTVQIDNTASGDDAGGANHDIEGRAVNAGALVAAGMGNVFETATGLGATTFTTAAPGVADALADNGGPAETLAITSASNAFELESSVASAAAIPSGSGGVDQRGFPRRSCMPDAGAFEVQPAALVITQGNDQDALVNAAFGTPLEVRVEDESGMPLEGYPVAFAARAAGASAALSARPAMSDVGGQASVTVTANGTSGSYSVTAGVDAVSAVFTLTNTDDPPTAMLVTAPDVTETESSYSLVVRYSDALGVDVGTLGTGDVRVTGPRGTLEANVTPTGDPGTGATAEDVTYTFAAPGAPGTLHTTGRTPSPWWRTRCSTQAAIRSQRAPWGRSRSTSAMTVCRLRCRRYRGVEGAR